MTTEEKNKVVLGVPVVVPVMIEKKEKNPATGIEETVYSDSEESLVLRPIAIRDWATLDATRVNDMPQKLIELTCRKSTEWVETVLNPSVFCSLYEKCREVNQGFFERLSLQTKLLEEQMANMEKLKALSAKSEQKQ